jgi:hypothetical protein
MTVFDRLAIMDRVVSASRRSESVLALWECGSAAFGRTDEFSDIDLGAMVAAGSTESVVGELMAAISEIAPITQAGRVKGDNWVQRFWQLQGAPAYNYIDLTLWEATPEGVTIDPRVCNPPIVHFDRGGGLHLVAESAQQRTQRVVKAIDWAAGCCAIHPVMVEKHILRGNVLQAYGEYQRSMIRPLIELLRAKHCPQRSSWHTTYISWDLPAEVNERLKPLVLVSDAQEMRKNLPIITAWKQTLIEELRKTYGVDARP